MSPCFWLTELYFYFLLQYLKSLSKKEIQKLILVFSIEWHGLGSLGKIGPSSGPPIMYVLTPFGFFEVQSFIHRNAHYMQYPIHWVHEWATGNVVIMYTRSIVLVTNFTVYTPDFPCFFAYCVSSIHISYSEYILMKIKFRSSSICVTMYVLHFPYEI